MAEQETFLSIAGLALRVLDDAPEPVQWLAQRCEAFHTRPTQNPAVITVAVRRNPALKPGPDELTSQPGADAGSFTLHGIDFTARRRRCGLPFEVEALPDAGMAGILRWVAGITLLEQGGLLLHSASCAIDGSGLAFAGPAGAGKTTLSRLLKPPVSLFTDETTAMRFEGVQPLIYSTPFAGELGLVGGPAEAPLETLCFLRHAPQTTVRFLRPAEAAAKLVGCVFIPVRQQPWLSAALAAIERLARAVPCVEFGFSPDESAVEGVHELIRASVPQA